MNAEILSIGTELLLGNILNTNSQFLSIELAKLGVSVYHHTSVGDNPTRLMDAITHAFSRADVVIATGGLGPTVDDITVECAAKYFGRQMVFDQPSLDRIYELFKARGITPVDSVKNQAYVVEGSIVLKNNNGLAPGCITEQDGKTLILLPGPPNEMKPMFESGLAPYLRSRSQHVFVSRLLHLAGIGESDAEDRVIDLIDSQDDKVTIAPYAKTAQMDFRITAKAATEEEGLRLMEPTIKEIYARLGNHIYGEDEITLEQVIVDLLKQKGLTLAIAESCTGGMVASKIISCPGASCVFNSGVVAYSNEAKVKRLSVSEDVLNTHGAVSKEVAEQMAIGIATTSGTDVGLAITGIAGPDSDGSGKPVGLVYVGIYIKGEVTVKEFRLFGIRDKIRMFATISALNALRKELTNDL